MPAATADRDRRNGRLGLMMPPSNTTAAPTPDLVPDCRHATEGTSMAAGLAVAIFIGLVVAAALIGRNRSGGGS